jgi:hypothetical protein
VKCSLGFKILDELRACWMKRYVYAVYTPSKKLETKYLGAFRGGKMLRGTLCNLDIADNHKLVKPAALGAVSNFHASYLLTACGAWGVTNKLTCGDQADQSSGPASQGDLQIGGWRVDGGCPPSRHLRLHLILHLGAFAIGHSVCAGAEQRRLSMRSLTAETGQRRISTSSQ